MEDESVKIICEEMECKFNLFLKTRRSSCKLKYITITGRTVDNFGVVPGTCMEMELR